MTSKVLRCVAHLSLLAQLVRDISSNSLVLEEEEEVVPKEDKEDMPEEDEEIVEEREKEKERRRLELMSVLT